MRLAENMEGLVLNIFLNLSRKQRLLFQIEVDEYHQEKQTNYHEDALAAHIVFVTADKE